MFEMRAKMISVGLLGAAVMLPVDLANADQLGHASWYSLPANKTANGERMNPNELTAAHRSLPFGTRVLVENLANGRTVVVRINDRGPFIGGRIIDLSKAAAASIGMIDAGTAKVRVTTTGGNAVAALGAATAKAKTGASAAKASSRKHIAKQPDVTKAKVRVASESKRSKSARSKSSHVRVAASTKGIYAAAQQASRLQTKRVIVATAHPYAVLGTTPGFMKPGRAKARHAG